MGAHSGNAGSPFVAAAGRGAERRAAARPRQPASQFTARCGLKEAWACVSAGPAAAKQMCVDTRKQRMEAGAHQTR